MERVSQEATKTKNRDVEVEVSAGAKAVSEDVASRLHHSEPVVRQAAAAALGALGEVAAEHISQLAMLIQDVDSGVRRAAAIALGNLGQKAVGHVDVAWPTWTWDDMILLYTVYIYLKLLNKIISILVIFLPQE